METLEGLNIDWNAVEELSYKPLPEGTYAAKVTEAVVKESKKGDGKYVNIKYTLLGGKGVKNRTIYDVCMIKHTNPDAVNAGLGKIKKLASLLDLDLTQLQSFSELAETGKPVGVKLKIEESEEYGNKNAIKAVVEFSEEFLSSSEETSF